MISWNILKSLIFFIFAPTILWAGSDCATCKISIQDINEGTTYYIDHKFYFVRDGVGLRKHFNVPGTDFRCTLCFFEPGIGTMLSCENNSDLGQTYFQSDRSGLSDNSMANNLTFRFKSNFISIKTECELIDKEFTFSD